MNNKDAERLISNLQTKPFICGENEIITDNGYVVIKKDQYEKLKLADELYHAVCKEYHINGHSEKE